MTRSELADRIEKAEGPSRELDAEIMAIRGTHVLEKRDSDRKEWWYPVDGSYLRLDPSPYVSRGGVPRFSSSIDAAMTLVPEKYKGDFAAGGSCGEGVAYLGVNWRDCGLSDHRAYAATPALALVAAALRAQDASHD